MRTKMLAELAERAGRKLLCGNSATRKEKKLKLSSTFTPNYRSKIYKCNVGMFSMFLATIFKCTSYQEHCI